MQITEERWLLAFQFLSLIKRLSGERFTETDVDRLARGFARRDWIERQRKTVTTH